MTMPLEGRLITFNESKKELEAFNKKTVKNDFSPVTIEGISISIAGYDEIEDMIKKATLVYNRELATQDENNIEDKDVSHVIELYRHLYSYSSYLVCKTSKGEIIGSLCTSIKKGPVSFKIEQDFKNHISPEDDEKGDINIFYGSVTFIDKDYIERSQLKKSLATELWSQMLKMTAEMTINTGEGVYLSHTEKSAYSVIKKILGMPWEQIGEETSWLNSTVIPCMITTEGLIKWLSKK